MGRKKLWDHWGQGPPLRMGEEGLDFADSHCGAHRRIHLNAWFLVGGTI